MKWQTNSRYNVPVEDGTIFKNEVASISIHRIIHCSGWYLSCAELGFSQQKLNGETFDEAVTDAKQLIKNKMVLLKEKYDGFLNDDSNNEIVRYF